MFLTVVCYKSFGLLCLSGHWYYCTMMQMHYLMSYNALTLDCSFCFLWMTAAASDSVFCYSVVMSHLFISESLFSLFLTVIIKFFILWCTISCVSKNWGTQSSVASAWNREVYITGSLEYEHRQFTWEHTMCCTLSSLLFCWFHVNRGLVIASIQQHSLFPPRGSL